MDRWIINRAGVINFWYYDDEEFEFEDGRLLLRGSNGSGKSVTMQSLVPLLFDGNKSPERLDPFGSRARKMDSYLLSDGLNLDERTGYLFLEFYKPESKRYKTIGMGMRARKNMPVQKWYFIVNDNRRIGLKYDLSLYKDIGDKIPLTQKELENKLGSGGYLYTRQKDYKAAVNDHLFGYQDLTDFDELIELLIQIRSPKLSKEFKPTTMYEIMQNSLFTLTEEDLRPMSEAIESMDLVKDKIDGLISSKKSIDRIFAAYNKYNEYLLVYKGSRYQTYRQEAEKSLKGLKKLMDQKDEGIKALEAINSNIEDLSEEERLLRQKENQLKENDLSKLVEDKLELEQNIENILKDLEKKHITLEKLKTDEKDWMVKKSNQKELYEVLQEDILKVMESMKAYSQRPQYDECDFMIEEYQNESRNVNFDYYKKHLKTYIQRVKKGLEAIKAYEWLASKYNQLMVEKDIKQKFYEQQERKTLDFRQQLNEIREEYAEKIMLWHGNNHVFTLDQWIITKVVDRVFQYGELYTYDKVIEPIREVYGTFVNLNNQKISAIKGQQDIILKEIEEKEGQVENLKNLKDIEPKRDQGVIKNRQLLDQEGIAYMPLYQSLDFHKDLNEDLKNSLEEGLLNLGLLDALIIDPKYKDQVLNFPKGHGDKYIFSNPNILSHNLSTYLKVDPSVEFSSALINDVIQSVFLDQNSDLFILENGIYGNGIILGKTCGNYESKYISFLSRKRHKENQIKEINDAIALMKLDIGKLDEKLKDFENTLTIGQKEYEAFPEIIDLETAYVDLIENERILKGKKMDYDDILLKVEEEYKALNDAKRLQHEQTHDLYLKLSVDIYEEALEDLDDYLEALYELINLDEKLKGKAVILEAITSSLDLCIENQDELMYDINKHDSDLRKHRNKLATVESQLQVSDYDSFIKELGDLRQRLNEIPSQIKDLYSKQSTKQTEINGLIEKEAFDKQKLEGIHQGVELYAWAFEKEWKLNYTSLFLEDLSLDHACEHVMKAYGSVLKEEKSVIDLREQVYKKFHEEQGILVDYNMKISSLFKDMPFDKLDENDSIHIERIDITSRVQGKSVKFSEMVNMIQAQIDINQNLLDEQDRELFEEILIKSVSRKISAKIYHSEKWVKEIDALMSGMDTSSGLKLNLRWITKNAQTEDQLSTKELVNILKGDQSLLTQNQRDSLIQHFRSKIKESKMRLGTEDKRSFLAIMKDVLDYRKWFEFQLYYTKTGDQKKELTNNAFFTFSGGEKAMAMYVPLFSAVYAKYQSGSKDCPKVISLDEAFAGVDDKNIKDMFKLLVELDLSFIANSQVLFGDYESVPDLGIYELIRPENVTFVTLIRYKWNGLVRSMVMDDEG